MSKLKVQTRTTYFIVTPQGRLKQVRPIWLVLVVMLLLASAVYGMTKVYDFNQNLLKEESYFVSQLNEINVVNKKLSSELSVCEGTKDKICNLLNFNKSDSQEEINDE